MSGREIHIKKQVKDVFYSFMDSYFTNRDLEKVLKVFSSNITNIGSGNDEITLNYNEAEALFKRDRQQCPNPITYQILHEKIDVISDNCALYIASLNSSTTINGIPYQGKGYRFSILICLEDDKWCIRHIHYSKAEEELEEGESFPIRQIEERNKKLEQIVAERTRELSSLNEELRKANNNILEAHIKFESVFENVSDGIIVFNKKDQRFYMVNRRICDYLGYNRETFLNLWIDKLVPEAFISHALHVLFPQQHDKLSVSEVLPCVSQKGELLYFDVNARLINIAGKEYHVAVFRDITHKRLSEELRNEMEIARQASEAKDLFLANISHEIRTPVTGILGMTEILGRTPLNNQQKEYLDIIFDSSKILLELINDILDISKIDAGKIGLKEEVFDFQNMLSNMKSMFEFRAQQKKLSFQIKIAPNIPVMIRADRHRLGQIFMNLINNAIKFTETGGVEVRVSVIAHNQDAFTIKVEVHDTGIGIQKSQMKKLFQKFSQLDNSYTRSVAGTGLGLVICKELVSMMGGDIGVESEPLVGSNFWFSFNAMSCDEEVTEKEQNYVFSKESCMGAGILVVDDKFVNQKVISIMLQNLGCNVDVAKNGKDAIDVFKHEVHKLILMDIMMPVMDGITSMQELHRLHKKLPPIIALTANAMKGDAEKYLNLGFDGYLAKPVTEEDLQKLLQKWLNEKKTPISI
ncbi:MAG: response regulator [Bacteroidales bacterium]|nr:response regulator [Bacteroidales bacterium]